MKRHPLLAVGAVVALMGILYAPRLTERITHLFTGRPAGPVFDTIELTSTPTIINGPPRTCTFSWTNHADVDVRIRKVAISCGCTASSEDVSDPVAPGGQGTVRLTFTPDERPGLQRLEAKVVWADNVWPISTIVMYVPVCAPFTVVPSAVDFEPGSRKRVYERHVQITNRTPVSVRFAVRPEKGYVTASLSRSLLAPGETADLKLATTDQIEGSEWHDSIAIGCDVPEMPDYVLQVSGHMYPTGVVPQAKHINMGFLTQNVAVRKTIALSSAQGQAVVIESVAAPPLGLRLVEQKNTPDGHCEFTVEVDCNACKPGQVKGQVVARVRHGNERVEIGIPFSAYALPTRK